MANPSREDLAKEMYEKLQQTQNAQYMNEVAMPSVYRPVKKSDADKKSYTSD